MSGALAVDLFCGGGGASVGYWLAGYEVIGVDIAPQPHYPFPFVRADVMTLNLEDFVVERAGGFDHVLVHASPPCQRWSVMTPAGKRDGHPDLVEPMRRRLASLVAGGVSSVTVMENVPGAPMVNAVRICGGGLGLGVRRHRLFEVSEAVWGVPCSHPGHSVPSIVGGYGGVRRSGYVTADEGREAMNAGWLPWPALVQSIPPEYTRFLGEQLLTRRGVLATSRDIGDLRRRCRCGKELVRCVTGRWPLHCSQACRQAAYRDRSRGSAGGVG